MVGKKTTRTVAAHGLWLGLVLVLGAAPVRVSAESPVFGRLNAVGAGEFSGKLQGLLMRRDDGDGDASSETLALTLGYRSPDLGPLSFGLQGIHASKIFEAGSDEEEGSARLIHNSDFSLLSEAYVTLKLDGLGMPKTALTVGRKMANYDFAPTYPIRQKPQALEGVFLEINPNDNLHVEIGHVERFSSWSTRDGDDSHDLHYDFQDVEEVYADHDSVNVPNDPAGLQFVNARATLGRRFELTAYDVFGYNLYNTAGAKVDILLQRTHEASIVWKNHVIAQNDVGNYDSELAGGLDAYAFETALASSTEDLLFQPGIFMVLSRDALRHPMESSFMWEYTMNWYTRATLGKSQSAYVKTVYTLGKTTLYGLWFVTDHTDDVGADGQALDQEVNVVVKHQFSDSLSAAVKAGYGHRDNRFGDNDEQEDYRLFITYDF